jgi:hypothetical protein
MRRFVAPGVAVLFLAFAPAAFGAEGSDRLYPFLRGGKWGYIDRSGTVVIEPGFDEAAEFLDGLARVKVGGKPGYIDRTGNFVWPAGD